jgi:hypothetical protein
MRHKDMIRRKLMDKVFLAALVVCLFMVLSPANAQGSTEKVTLQQDHRYGAYDDTDSSYYYLYPNDKYKDYKKFMKFTYIISDDSVIGLRINGNVDFNSEILDEDKNGNQICIAPNDIKVHALGPGTATLKVYNGKKLIDSYSFTVKSDIAYSPSSFVSTDGVLLSDETKEEERKLIKQFIMKAVDPKYTTTNQRIEAALNATIAYGGRIMSEKEYTKIYNESKYDLWDTYMSAYSRLIDKNATVQGYAEANKIMLSNMGFWCEADEDDPSTASNYLKLYMRNEGYEEQIKERDELFRQYNEDEEFREEYGELDEDDLGADINKGVFESIQFTATNKLTSEYDFSVEDKDSIYNRTHLPAWINREDTKQQVISEGQTISISSSDMNNNIYSSNTSVVKVENGSITGVKPGIAIVYRYNDTYCDVFFVIVKKKSSAKTINAKVYHKSVKSYFTDSDYAPYILGGQRERDQIEAWKSLRLYELEPIFGHGGQLVTEYSKGIVKCYLEYEGDKQLLCSIGTSRFAD